VQIRKSAFSHIPEIIQRIASFYHTSPKHSTIIHIENGNTVYRRFEKFGLFKNLRNNPVYIFLKLTPNLPLRPEQRSIILKLVQYPVVSFYIVISPHDIKLHFRLFSLSGKKHH
jgi:hypothetical protein